MLVGSPHSRLAPESIGINRVSNYAPILCSLRLQESAQYCYQIAWDYLSQVRLNSNFLKIIFVTASCIITNCTVTVWKSGKNLGSYDYCSWGYIFLCRNKCMGGGAHSGPIQDGSHADTSAPIGSVSLWSVYIYIMSMASPPWEWCSRKGSPSRHWQTELISI